MVEKVTLLKRYREGRIALAMIIGFMLFDTISLAISPTAPLLFVAVVPQIAIAYARFYFDGLQAILLVLLFVVVPILLNIICFIMSKEEHKWLGYSTFMLMADMVGLVTFVFLYGFEPQMIIDIFAEFCFIYYIFRGYNAGYKLKDDFVEEEELEEQQPEKVITIGAYRYDEEMAKTNKTKKGGLVFVALLGLIAMLLISFFIIGFVDTYGSLSEAGMAVLAVGLLVVSFVSYVAILSKITPYTTAKNVQYFELDNEVCRCIKNDGSTVEKLKNLKVIAQTNSEFKCQYETATGKVKRLIIPNCYPGIEKILKK